jgi:hypothetical protein
MAGRQPFECRKQVSSDFMTWKCWNCGRRVLNSTTVLQFHIVSKSRGCTTTFCCVTVLINLTSQPLSLRASEHCEQNGHLYLKIQVFWHMTVCRWVSGSRRVGNHWPNDTVSYPQNTWTLKNTAVRITNNTLSLQCYKTYRGAVMSNIHVWRQCYNRVYWKKQLGKYTKWNYPQNYYL